jgi:heme exporter protein B
MTARAEPGRGGPGFFEATWLVASKDLRIEWRTLDSLASMVLFSLIVMVVFNFAFDLATIRELGAAKLVPGVIWITFSFSAIIGFTRSFRLERRRDAIVALLQAPVGRGAIFTGKAVASVLTVWTLQAIILPLSAIFFDYDLLRILGPMVLVVALHTIGLAVLGILFGAMVSRLGRGEALLATLLFPASTPLFLSAVRCTRNVIEQAPLGEVSNWLLIATGFDVLYFLVALVTFEFVIED